MKRRNKAADRMWCWAVIAMLIAIGLVGVALAQRNGHTALTALPVAIAALLFTGHAIKKEKP